MSKISLWAGVDVSKDRLDVSIEPTGHHCSYTHNDAGIAELLDDWHEQTALIVMEASGGHEKPVLRALQQAGWPVALVNALRLRNCARSRGILAKTDKIDADVLAHYASVIQPAPSPVLRDEQYRLKKLCQAQAKLQDNTGEKPA